MYSITEFILFQLRPRVNAILVRLLHRSYRIHIGKKFRTDSFPRIIVDRSAKLAIGNNVEFRRNVEIRVHGSGSVYIEDNVRIDRGVRILAANHACIRIGKDTRIGLYSVLNGGDSISIGAKSLISGFVYLQTSMHGFRNKELTVQEQGYDHKPIVLEQDTWLGAHVVVLPGVVIERGAVIGSNSVVNTDIKNFQVAAGVPAKIISERT
jgi:acetyltransferase-like isoleucine patch superfamily enzyme